MNHSKSARWVSWSAALGFFALAGCSRAQPGTNAAAQAAVYSPFTNSVMADFKKPSEAELKKKLTPLQFDVTQRDGTEPPFDNEYWNNKKPGIYVDLISGIPLFSSLDKFDSGCGWPSFTQPIGTNEVAEHTDRTLGVVRTEVRSKMADSHLGHVFDDGPAPTGLRYCIDSAAVRFVPVEEMEKDGYASYLGPFIRAGLYKEK